MNFNFSSLGLSRVKFDGDRDFFDTFWARGTSYMGADCDEFVGDCDDSDADCADDDADCDADAMDCSDAVKASIVSCSVVDWEASKSNTSSHGFFFTSTKS